MSEEKSNQTTPSPAPKPAATEPATPFTMPKLEIVNKGGTPPDLEKRDG